MNMAVGSSSSHLFHIVDDFYFSALHDDDDIFPISDEKYAHQLQLQEALISSSSLIMIPSSSPFHQNASSSSSSSSLIMIPSSSPFHQNASSSSLIMIPSSSPFHQNASSSSSSSLIMIPSSSPFHQNASSSKMQPILITEEEEEEEKEGLFCEICMDRKSPSDMFRNINVCGHLFCLECIRRHVAAKIKENITQVKCPDPKCKGLIGPEICRSIIPKQVLERWEESLCESLILGSQKFYCPFKDCSAMLVDDGGETVTSSECPNCNRLFCAQCKVVWHSGMDCGEFQKGERDSGDVMLMELAKNNKWRRCPSCKFYVEKTDGCLHISCRCGYHFCYGCGNEHHGSHACPFS